MTAPTWSLAVHATDGDWLDGHLAHLQLFSKSRDILDSIRPGDVIVSFTPTLNVASGPSAEAIRRLDRLDPLDTTRARIVFRESLRAPFKVLGGHYAWANPASGASRQRLSSGKLKFDFKGKDSWTKPFITSLQGRTTEIIFRDPDQLQYTADAAEEASGLPGSDQGEPEQLKKIIMKIKGTNGTKAQPKSAFKEDGTFEKVAVVVNLSSGAAKCVKIELNPRSFWPHAR